MVFGGQNVQKAFRGLTNVANALMHVGQKRFGDDLVVLPTSLLTDSDWHNLVKWREHLIATIECEAHRRSAPSSRRKPSRGRWA
jgi:hypothetical protein